MKFETIALVIFALLVAGSLAYYFSAKHNCNESGGELVRGTWAYSCVEEVK